MKALPGFRNYPLERNCPNLGEHLKMQPAHMAYCLCYPCMVKQKETRVFPGPWDQPDIYDSEAV
jgi:hypothetical protein